MDPKRSDPERRARRRPPHRAVPPAALAIVAVTGGLLLAACGDDDTTEAGAPGTTTAPAETPAETAGDVPVTAVDVVAGGAAGEFAFTTDLETIEAGRVRVELTNQGEVEHQAMLLRIDDRTDFAGLLAAGAQGPDAFLGLVDGYGGPNGAGPGGGTATSTQDLEPGRYLLACLIPDGAGVPHLAQGMFREFTVTAPTAPDPAAPAIPASGDATIDLLDFGFAAPRALEAGATVAVTNHGEQGHEVLAYRIDDGATIEDVADALAHPASGPPPVDPAGAGLGIVRPGGTATFTLPDRTGRYALVCFVPDVAGDLASHHRKGMLLEVELTAAS